MDGSRVGQRAGRDKRQWRGNPLTEGRAGLERGMSTTHWRILLGAHKTASTALQDMLAGRREELAGMGIHCPTREELRACGLAAHLGPSRGHRFRPWFLQRPRLNRSMVALRSPLPTLLLAEEQLLGFVPDLLEPRPYRELEVRLGRLDRLVGDAEAALFLAVRSPATLLPSAYAHKLCRGNWRGDFAPIARRALARPPSWTRLAERIRAAMPGRPLRVWTFEDFLSDPSPVMDALVGRPLSPWSLPSAPPETRSPSAEAMAAMQAIHFWVPRRMRRRRCAELRTSDAGNTRYSPFSPEETAFLDAAYAADLRELDRVIPGARLRAG